jgi:hypothetical protein
LVLSINLYIENKDENFGKEIKKFNKFITSCGNIGLISTPKKQEFSYLFDKSNNHVPGPHLKI